MKMFILGWFDILWWALKQWIPKKWRNKLYRQPPIISDKDNIFNYNPIIRKKESKK